MGEIKREVGGLGDRADFSGQVQQIFAVLVVRFRVKGHALIIGAHAHAHAHIL